MMDYKYKRQVGKEEKAEADPPFMWKARAENAFIMNPDKVSR